MDVRNSGLAIASLLLVLACSTPEAPMAKRAELRLLGPALVEVVPAAGQLPYCLVFTASERGVVRQLTMNADQKSVPCDAGQPIGGVKYRIPPEEGKVRLYVLFSDQVLSADGIAQQVREIATSGRLVTAMDLRAPGQLQIEALEIAPSAAVVPAR